MIETFIKNYYKYIAAILLITIAFATGRYTVPVKVETKTVTVEVEHKVEDKKVNTITVEVLKPDGTKTITTTDKTETKTNTNDKTTDTYTSLVENKKQSVNISLLGGIDVSDTKFVYGASISKTLIGPVTIGLWGMSNKTIGTSLGLQF